jgi:23S rRNA (guanine2445-N2)-methyltransferase / 23S rRNA (guanine2069-N7)-methyltransferase
MLLAQSFFATAPLGVEPLLADELRLLGATSLRETRAGVYFTGTLELAYRVCLWSRLASRVFLPLAEFAATSPQELYEGARNIPWSEHLDSGATFAVDATITSSEITHSRFAALKIKDAIVDVLREERGFRPDVDVEKPDLRFNLYLRRDRAIVSLDLSGESLHKRGYRQETVLAPLKENLAAAILLRAGWPKIAAAGGALIDPMCGSGTFVIEAAMIAADIAPGLYRDDFGFKRWRGHDDSFWRPLVAEARQRREIGMARLPLLCGFDSAAGAIRAARVNADAAGFGGKLRFERRDVEELVRTPGCDSGLVVVNPPYGERLGEKNKLAPLYGALGARLRSEFVGWKAAIFTGNPELARAMEIRPVKQNTLFNGALECRLLHFQIENEYFYGAATRPPGAEKPLSAGAEMFANRLRKNLKSLGKWARSQGIECYRLYDADMPEYAVAVDLYGPTVHVQEYEAPKTIDEEQARLRLVEILAALPVALAIPREKIALKVRKKQKGAAQYEKFGAEGRMLEVREGAARLLVNLTDYLDTGLFLDHRDTRQLIHELAPGKEFLNLFCYTGAFTVQAALGGARRSVSVDMSSTYIKWAERNFVLNGMSTSTHELVQADCLTWVKETRRKFDLIFLDPPTFSNSKSMRATFDVQRDYVPLLRSTSRLLNPGGVLIFSNNNRRFKMDVDALPELEIVDITAKTIPRDFARNPRIHNCWMISRKG